MHCVIHFSIVFIAHFLFPFQEIKASAYCHRELEIFFAMDRIARQRLTFGHIIKALLNTERFDVLREIEPFVTSKCLSSSL